MSRNINPYDLLGLPTKSNLKELRKAYYNLSLLCHPDKGGNDIEMNIVHNAYLYIQDHLNNCKNTKSYETLEEDFENFCHDQKSQPPPFCEIYDNCNEFFREFNKEFERINYNDNDNDNNCNPFNLGYGDLMESSHNTTIDYPQNDENCPVKEDFGKHLIAYKEPNFLPDTYGNYSHLNNKKITDFSHQNDNLSLTDYVKAFSEYHIDENDIDKTKFTKTYDELIKERDLLSDMISNNQLNSTPILDNYTQKRDQTITIIQSYIRRFLIKQKLPILKKLNYLRNQNIDFDKYIIILQRKWRNKQNK